MNHSTSRSPRCLIVVIAFLAMTTTLLGCVTKPDTLESVRDDDGGWKSIGSVDVRFLGLEPWDAPNGINVRAAIEVVKTRGRYYFFGKTRIELIHENGLAQRSVSLKLCMTDICPKTIHHQKLFGNRPVVLYAYFAKEDLDLTSTYYLRYVSSSNLQNQAILRQCSCDSWRSKTKG